ncbi:energy-coupling factor transporter transmembrane component T family protein [Halomicroarcula sp. GCM10025709]|uniref:energy-coupling factor transporter transmembrane component T family protein n=1 Tax=Haloarcula TaxID=2237 RepID=UPI0024C31EA9|nr:energy-coupling factor transporter transmembrane component T [Halomicroarcula sp. YJ-61-S]
MLTYEPGATFAHRLDARAKLAFQIGFAVAVFSRPTPVRLAGLAILAGVGLAAGRLSPVTVLRNYWFVVAVLALGPLSATVVLGPPWLAPDRALAPTLAVGRVLLVLFVSAVYVRTTPVRATRAAIQRHVPGRFGQALGVGVAITFRFLPVLRRDLLSVRDAIRARGGQRRSVVDRAQRIALVGLGRALGRADRLSVALRARCFAWNPTPPAMAFERRDYPVVAVGFLLALSPLVSV